jgi:hypothetical protein
MGQRGGLGPDVAGAPRRSQGIDVHGGGVGQVVAEVEVALHGRGELDRAGLEAGVPRCAVPGRHERDRGGQVRPLAVEPAARRLGVREARRPCTMLRRARPTRDLGGEEQVHRLRGGAQIVVEEGCHRRMPGPGLVLDLGELPGEAAQQIVHLVPVRADRPHQRRAGQPVEHPAGAVRLRADERRRGRDVEVRAGVQRDQAQGARGGGLELPVGPGQHGAHGGPRVPAGVQHVEPPAQIGELADEFGQRDALPRDRHLRGHPQRERKPDALGDQGADGFGLGLRARPDQRAEQRRGLVVREQVELHPARAVPGDEPGQRVPAGDQHPAARHPGQQRAHLLGVAGVVQQQQDAPAGQQTAQPRGPLVLVARYSRGVRAERAQQPGQRVGRRTRRAGVVAAQVHVQLPVGELARRRVRPVHGQCGLAHPGRAADHHGGAGAGRRQQPGELGRYSGTADEAGNRGGQLPRYAERRVLRGRRGCEALEAGPFGLVRHRLVPRPAPRREEVLARRPAQAQRVGEPQQRVAVRPAGAAALQIADRAHAQPAAVGQVLLREPGGPAPGAQPAAERSCLVAHADLLADLFRYRRCAPDAVRS